MNEKNISYKEARVESSAIWKTMSEKDRKPYVEMYQVGV